MSRRYISYEYISIKSDRPRQGFHDGDAQSVFIPALDGSYQLIVKT